eukprot:jgi/Astpho2/6482/Aster-x0731
MKGPMQAAKVWYLMYCAGLQQIRFTETQIGLVAAVRPWTSALAANAWAALADATGAHRCIWLTCLSLSALARFSITQFTHFGTATALVLLTEVFSAPICVLMDATVTALATHEGEYGAVRCWGAVGYGICCGVAGVFTQRLGLYAGFAASLLMHLLTLVPSSQIPIGARKGAHLNDRSTGLRRPLLASAEIVVDEAPGHKIQPTPEHKPGEASAPLGKVASYVTIIQPLEEWFEGQVQDAQAAPGLEAGPRSNSATSLTDVSDVDLGGLLLDVEASMPLPGMPSGQGWVINWQAYLPHDVATQLSRQHFPLSESSSSLSSSISDWSTPNEDESSPAGEDRPELGREEHHIVIVQPQGEALEGQTDSAPRRQMQEAVQQLRDQLVEQKRRRRGKRGGSIESCSLWSGSTGSLGQLPTQQEMGHGKMHGYEGLQPELLTQDGAAALEHFGREQQRAAAAAATAAAALGKGKAPAVPKAHKSAPGPDDAARRSKQPHVVRIDVEDRAVAPPPTGLPKISHAQPQPDDTGKGTLPLRPPPVSTGQAEAERAATEEHAADLIRPLDTQQKAMLTASAGQAASKGLATTNIRQPDAQQRAEQAASRKHAAATIRQPETWHGAPPATSAEEAVAPTGLQHEAQREAEPAAAKEPPVSLERSSAHSQQAVALA